MKGKGGEGDNPGAKDLDTRPLETLKDRNAEGSEVKRHKVPGPGRDDT